MEAFQQIVDVRVVEVVYLEGLDVHAQLRLCVERPEEEDDAARTAPLPVRHSLEQRDEALILGEDEWRRTAAGATDQSGRQSVTSQCWQTQRVLVRRTLQARQTLA
jgi:hypothetical protein